MRKIDFIQALRGVAAILVMLFHIKFLFDYTPDKIGTTLWGGGNIGVDLFFIISGFIMVYTNHSKSGNKASLKFIINRFTRIFPLYFSLSVIYYTVHFNLHGWTIPSNIAGFIKVMLFIPFQAHPPPFYGLNKGLFTVAWTLQFEMFFYILFAISLLFKSYRWVFLYCTFVLLILVIPVLSGHFRINIYQPAMYRFGYLDFITNPMFLEFLMGIFVAKVYLSEFRINLTLNKIFLAISIVLAGYYYFTVRESGFGPFHYGFPCFLLLLSLLLLHKHYEIRVPKVLMFLGDMSYSIYLFHFLMIMIILKIPNTFIISSERNVGIFFIFYIAVVIGGSYVTYRFIELRISNAFRSKLFKLFRV